MSGGRIWPRKQPPTHSPLSLGTIARGLHAALTPSDPRVTLTALIERAYGGTAVLCSSGTDALTRAIRLADAMSGGTGIVALPAYACYDLATAAVGADTRVVLYDLDPATLAPDLGSLRAALQQGAGVVVCAPLYGLTVNWTALTNLTNEFGAVVIEDAAQAFGATWRGRPLASLGAISIVSFGRGKGWTGSHGGALLVRGCAVKALHSGHPTLLRGALPPASGLGDVFTAAVQHVLGRPTIYALPASIPWLGLGETRYHAPTPTAEMSRAAAAMLVGSHSRALAEVAMRREAAAWYGEQLASSSSVCHITTSPDDSPAYLRFPLRVSGGFGGLGNRRRAAALGLSAAYPTLLSALGVIRDRLHCELSLAGAAVIQRELVTLPTHSMVSVQERADIVSLLAASARPRRAAVAPTAPAIASGVRVGAGARADTSGGV